VSSVKVWTFRQGCGSVFNINGSGSGSSISKNVLDPDRTPDLQAQNAAICKTVQNLELEKKIIVLFMRKKYKESKKEHFGNVVISIFCKIIMQV
jgi:hypothetical protein